jgi:hypothetical protein
VKLWLHSQQSVLALHCVAFMRPFFDILRTAAAGTSKECIGRERTQKSTKKASLQFFVFFEFFCGDGVLTRLVTANYAWLRPVTVSYA